jgi:16S rRNA (cytidine1402-2'-O)-methyltransferase
MKTTIGSIYLLPTFLGESANINILSNWELDLVQHLSIYFTENEKSARRFLRKAGFTGDLNSIQLHRVDKDTKVEEQIQLLELLKAGNDIGLISEAGCPAVADPGSSLIRLAHDFNIPVIPVPGPSSILLLLMASGLNGQKFTFNGYLPVEKNLRVRAIKDLENLSAKSGTTQIFIETPYRNRALLDDILLHCNPTTSLAIGANITEVNGWVKTKSIVKWKINVPDIQKIPSIFAILKD